MKNKKSKGKIKKRQRQKAKRLKEDKEFWKQPFMERAKSY